jgi:hypothetical protein
MQVVLDDGKAAPTSLSLAMLASVMLGVPAGRLEMAKRMMDGKWLVLEGGKIEMEGNEGRIETSAEEGNPSLAHGTENANGKEGGGKRKGTKAANCDETPLLLTPAHIFQFRVSPRNLFTTPVYLPPPLPPSLPLSGCEPATIHMRHRKRARHLNERLGSAITCDLTHETALRSRAVLLPPVSLSDGDMIGVRDTSSGGLGDDDFTTSFDKAIASSSFGPANKAT